MEDFKDFDINLYEDVDYEGNGDATTYSSWIGGNSSTSVVCSILTNLTESCNYCGGGTLTKVC